MPRILRPLTMESLAVTAVATSRMHTSLFRGRGSGTVLIWSTSGGPYAVQKTALICHLGPQLKRAPWSAARGCDSGLGAIEVTVPLWPSSGKPAKDLAAGPAV